MRGLWRKNVSEKQRAKRMMQKNENLIEEPLKRTKEEYDNIAPVKMAEKQKEGG